MKFVLNAGGEALRRTDLHENRFNTDARVVQKLDDFAACFQGAQVSSDPVGLCGRILRGVSADCFSSLSSDPGRRVVMLACGEELLKLRGKSIEEVLMTIGYSQSDITSKLKLEKNQFKMLVAGQSESLQPATWENVFALASIVYPEVAQILLDQKASIEKLTFAQIQQLAGYSFDQVQLNGPSDERFMTVDRLLQSAGNVVDVRAFFYHTLQLRELFSGDGMTRMPCGKVGLVEYIAPNIPLSDIGAHRLIDL